MGSKPKQGGTPGGGMSPGQSMAMAGNVGLASVSEADAVRLQNAIQNINRATGGNQGSSFQDIAQNIAEQGSKFRRPADTERYIDSMAQISDAINQGATVFTGADGIQRVNFAGTGIKNPETGATILSRQIPELTAVAPTLGQLGGDISRAFTGYNTLEFPQGSNVPTMVRKGGIADVLAKAAIPGSMALNIVQDLYGKGKNFLFPQEIGEDTFSSAADATGGAFVLPESLVPINIEREDIPAIDKRARLKELIDLDPAPGSSELNVDEMTDREVDLRLQSYGEAFAMGGSVPPEKGPESEGIESLFKNK